MDIRLSGNWTAEELQFVLDSIDRLYPDTCSKTVGSGKSWAREVDPAAVKKAIKWGDVGAALIGPFLFCYSIEVPWYGHRPILAEQLVLALRKGGNFRELVAGMQEIARKFSCVGICTGTALTPDTRLARVYTRLGFEPSGAQFYKEL